MKTWIKFYTDLNRDPELGGLSLAQVGLWSKLLALAGELDKRDAEGRETGELDTPARTAWLIRVNQRVLQRALLAFEERGLVRNVAGVIVLADYAELQARPDSDSREGVVARVRRHRAARRAARAAPVTPLPEEGNAPVTPPEAEAETEVTSGTAVPDAASALPDAAPTDAPAADGAGPVAAPPEVSPSDAALEAPPPLGPADDAPERAPQPPPAPSGHAASAPARASPVRARSPACRLYHAVAGVWPNRVQIAAIDAAVQDAARWEQAIRAWCERGFKPTNVGGMLDWYRKGIPGAGPPRRQAGGPSAGQDLPHYSQGLTAEQQRMNAAALDDATEDQQ